MRVWKSSILLFVGLAILVMSAVTVSAVTVTDDIDDAWYIRYDPITGTGAVSMVGDKPNIDIISVSYTITGSELTLTMTVDGTIAVDGTIEDTMFYYGIYFGNWKGDLTSSNYYMAVYANGSGFYGTVDIEPFVYGELADPVSGNTFTVTFEIADPDPTFEVWGIASESKGTWGEEDSVTWMDSAPNSYSPHYSGDEDDDDDDDDVTGDDDDEIVDDGDTGGDGDDDKGIPGFETITIISAIGIALILLRRKK